MNKIIVFDLDGTLITCMEKQVMLLKYIASSNKVKIREPDFFWELKRNGSSTFESLKILGISDDTAKVISQEWVSEVEDWYWLTHDTLYQHVFDMLNALKNDNNKLYLLTARKNVVNLYRQLDQINLKSYFHDVIPVAHKNVIGNKNSFLKKVSCDLFIGDTETDYQATLGTRVKFIACTEGQRNRDFLTRNGVRFFLDESDKLF